MYSQRAWLCICVEEQEGALRTLGGHGDLYYYILYYVVPYCVVTYSIVSCRIVSHCTVMCCAVEFSLAKSNCSYISAVPNTLR